MNMESKLEKLNTRRESVQSSKAYKWLSKLFDDGTFFELDSLARSGDGEVEVVAGYGSVEGCSLYAFSQNVEVDGGAMSRAQAAKLRKLYALAAETGNPIVGFFDSNGAKLGEGSQMMASYGEILAMSNNLSGVVPQISIIAGACQGTAALIASAADIVIMADGAKLQLSVDGLGGSVKEAAQEGIASIITKDVDEAIMKTRNLVTMLPSNNLDSADFLEYDEDYGYMPKLQQAAKAAAKGQPSAHDILDSICDIGSVVELQEDYGKAAVTALARIGGLTVGMALTDGMPLCAACASKLARFVRFCDAFSLPVISFVNVSEMRSLKEVSMLAHAYAEATTVKISVVTGTAIGAAFIALAGRGTGSDLTLAWPTAVISALNPEAAVSVLWTDRLKNMKNPLEDRAKLVTEYKETEASPECAAAEGFIDDIIDPALTRSKLVSALDMLSGKRSSRFPKKHSNIQL